MYSVICASSYPEKKIARSGLPIPKNKGRGNFHPKTKYRFLLPLPENKKRSILFTFKHYFQLKYSSKYHLHCSKPT